MPIQPYATGSVAVFVGRSISDALCLGYCEGYPKESHQPSYKMLKNDVSGTENPLDVSFQGITAQVSCVLTDWDDAVYQRLQGFPNFGISSPGSWLFSDVGTLMGLEKMAVQVWCQYLFSDTAGGGFHPVYTTLPPGYHYLKCVPWSPMEWETGTSPMKRHVQFFCWSVADFTERQFNLYDNDMSGLPDITGLLV